jgi:hypothetical protein
VWTGSATIGGGAAGGASAAGSVTGATGATGVVDAGGACAGLSPHAISTEATKTKTKPQSGCERFICASVAPSAYIRNPVTANWLCERMNL